MDDDAFGVGEALNEKAYGTGLVVVGRHRLLLAASPEQLARDHRYSASFLTF